MHKIQFAFSPFTLQKINDLLEQTEATSKAEVIRNALSFYDWAVRNNNNGKSLFSVAKDGTMEKIILPGLFSE